MTLDTRILIHDEIDKLEVLFQMRQLLGATNSHLVHDNAASEEGGRFDIGHAPGVGLPAWLLIYYRPDGPLAVEDVFETDDEEPYLSQRACFMEVSFDTAYSYNDGGVGCTELHAQYIVKLGTWLDGKGIRWGWINEYSDEYFTGEERYAALGEFLGSGDNAQEWFANIVKPMIEGLQ